MGFIEEYFIDPIVERSGYNVVNTLVYGIIAITASYLIFLAIKKKFNKKFIIYLLPFILFGSTMRVLTDFVDSGGKSDFFLTKILISTGFYDYSFHTVTPGIYIFVTVIFLISIALSKFWEDIPIYIGSILFVIHFLAIFPLFKNFNFLFLILFITAGFFIICYLLLKKIKIKNRESQIAVFSHLLDASSSFTAIEIINKSEICKVFGKCYFGQHVVENFLSTIPFGIFLFIVIKAIFSVLACYLIEKCEDENEKYFFYSIIITIGLAPGVRNTLRILIGV